jgi:hypothetical protein
LEAVGKSKKFMKNNIMTKSSVIAAIFLGLALAAKADSTVSYTNSASGTYDFGSTPLALQQFDSSLGTLESITISLQASSYTMLTVSNSSPSTYGSPSSVWNDSELLLGSSSFDEAVDALNPVYGSYALPDAWLDVVSPHFNVTGLASGATNYFSAANTIASGDPVVVSGITSGTIFTDLQGAGTINLDFYSESTVDSAIQGGATFAAVETVTGGPTVIVTYDYLAPTPEPATMAMFVLGLCGLAILRHRRSA